MTRKLICILIVAVIVLIAFTQRTWFIECIRNGGYIAVGLSILFTAICVFVPGVPFVITSGVIGNVYGTFTGTVITITGSMLAVMAMFLMARFGFSLWARKLIEKHPNVKQYETRFEKNAFSSVLVARLIPIIPGTLINVVSGLSDISWISFFLASLLAKLPVDLLFTFAGKEMQTNLWFSLLIYGAYMLVTVALIFIYRNRKRPSPSRITSGSIYCKKN